MKSKKQKESSDSTPLGKILKELKPKQTKALSLNIEIQEPFFARVTGHKYGTCWKCGEARAIPGGLPNAGESYWCDQCKEFLAVRNAKSDSKTVIIIESKKS